jgi:hypothetical protein
MQVSFNEMQLMAGSLESSSTGAGHWFEGAAAHPSASAFSASRAIAAAQGRGIVAAVGWPIYAGGLHGSRRCRDPPRGAPTLHMQSSCRVPAAIWRGRRGAVPVLVTVAR